MRTPIIKPEAAATYKEMLKKANVTTDVKTSPNGRVRHVVEFDSNMPDPHSKTGSVLRGGVIFDRQPNGAVELHAMNPYDDKSHNPKPPTKKQISHTYQHMEAVIGAKMHEWDGKAHSYQMYSASDYDPDMHNDPIFNPELDHKLKSRMFKNLSKNGYTKHQDMPDDGENFLTHKDHRPEDYWD